MASRWRLALVLLLAVASASEGVVITTQTPQAALSLGTPSMGSCGTSPSLAAGSIDGYGQITTGSGVVTACTLTFSKTLSRTPVCIISTNSTAITADVSAVSATAVTVGLSATLTSGQIYYHCLGAS